MLLDKNEKEKILLSFNIETPFKNSELQKYKN